MLWSRLDGILLSVISLSERDVTTLCSLFSIDGLLPKLNVAGSIPVSRSNLQCNYKDVVAAYGLRAWAQGGSLLLSQRNT